MTNHLLSKDVGLIVLIIPDRTRPEDVLSQALNHHTDSLKLKWTLGASLVAQWLRILLPMQGTRV